MRKELGKINGERTRFEATFSRYGTKTNYKGYPETTLLFKNITDGTKIVADHIWFSMTKGFENLGGLQEGEKIEFYARVKEYWKGYKGYKEDVAYEKPVEKDFKLSFPTKIQKIWVKPEMPKALNGQSTLIM